MSEQLIITKPEQVAIALDSEVIKAKAKEIALQCQQIIIVDEASLTIGTELTKSANKMSIAIEKKRKALKQPFLDMGKEIDRVAAELSKDIDDAVAENKKKILEYNKIVQEKQRLEAARIERERAEAEERERKEKLRIATIANWISDYETNATNDINASNTQVELQTAFGKHVKTFPADDFFQEFLPQGHAALARVKLAGKQRKLYIEQLEKERDGNKAEALRLEEEARQEQVAVNAEENKQSLVNLVEEKEQLIEMNTDITTATLASRSANLASEKVSGITKRWKFKIDNVNNVPLHWLVLDEKVVNQFLKDNKVILAEGEIINGIMFYQEEGVRL